MGAGDLTASTPVICQGGTEVKNAVDALTLAATTDKLVVVPISQTNETFFVFKVEREA